MPHIIRTQRWLRQPPYPTEIDLAHPLAKGLRGTLSYGGGYHPINAVTQQLSSSGYGYTGITRIAARSGIGYRYGGSGYNSFSSFPGVPGHEKKVTHVCVFTPVTSNAGGVLSTIFGTTSSVFGSLRLNANGTVETLPGSPLSFTALVSTNIARVGDTNVVVLAINGNAGEARQSLYLNGVLEAESAVTTGGGFTPTGLRWGNNALGTLLLHHFAAHVGVTMTHDEALELTRNPWQIFKPRKRVTFFLGSFGIPTLSLPGVTEIGTTSARPRVTLTY